MNSADVTAILRQFSSGDMEAARDLIPLVYQQLRRMAAYQLRREHRDHTLQSTALVHEAYLRLIEQKEVQWLNHSQFLGVAAQLVRRILVDYARRPCR